MGEYFSIRSRLLIYEYAMGTSSFASFNKQTGDLYKKWFSDLSEGKKTQITQAYQELDKQIKRPPLTKMQDAVLNVASQVPLFEIGWLLMGMVIPIMLLRQIESAKQAVWLLPLLTFCFGIDNQYGGKPSYIPPDYALFPEEKELQIAYTEKPIKGNPDKQKEALEKGWQNYLIANWAGHSASTDHKEERANFNFTIERLLLLSQEGKADWLSAFNQKKHPAALLSYLCWNLFFAYFGSKGRKNKK